jgi:hypothetical protein
MRTVLQLVDDVHAAAVNVGMDVSVKDVAFILSTFIEGMANDPAVPSANASLQALADEISKAKEQG